MNKIIEFKRQMIVENHQILSFSPFFAKIKGDYVSEEELVFFPGCSLMSLGEESVMQLYDILLKSYPKMKLSGFCCGKPSKHIWGGKKFKSRIEKIKKHHKGTIYTACPNCFKTFGDEGFKVESIWPVVDEYFPEEKLNIYDQEQITIHDPCTARNNVKDHDAVRSIMNKMGISVVEFDNSRTKTLCCGKINMTMALNPEKGIRILEKRVSQCKTDKIASYCASCVHSFGMAGKQGFYISELLLKKKNSPSWINRINFVKTKLK